MNKKTAADENAQADAMTADMASDPTADDGAGTILKNLQDYHDRNTQLIATVRRRRAEWNSAANSVSDAKEIAKARRQDYDKAVADLLAFGSADSLPFGQLADDAAAAGADEPNAAAPWRACSLDGPDFDGLTPAILLHLANARIAAAGELADFQNEHGEFWAQDIPGIGPTAQTAIEDAWERFWEAHPAANYTGDGDGDGDGSISNIQHGMSNDQVNGEADGEYDEAEQIAATIAKAPQDIACRAIAACTDPDILKAAAAHDECTGDWRRSAIDKRIEELDAA